MVKSTFIIASIASIAVSSVVVAQNQAVPTALPSGVTFPSGPIPSDAANAISSLLQNPAGIQSYISMASQQVGQLPTQYQASAYSALAAASKSVDALQPNKTPGSTVGSAGNLSYKPTGYFAAFVISAVIAAGVIM